MTFQELELDEKLLRNLKTEGYTRPTPIQEQAIPILLQGRDLIGCAQTGTGKTAAFSLPMLQRLFTNPPARGHRDIRALIVAPTRELAIQINDSLNAYGRHTGLRNTVIFGGVSASKQIEQLRRGVDILTATPGRLLDLHNQGEVHFDGVEILVLDEADRMLDMGFIHDIRRIMALLPARRQTLLFSATMPPEVRAIADQYLHRPQEITVELPKEKHLKIEEWLYHVDKPEKTPLLAHLIRKHEVQKGIIFTRTKHGADKLARQLSRASIAAGAIHGNKSQNARQRALEDFRSGRIHILVASDIAARGLDIDDITHVFNFEIPEVAETYVHRIGRTGRAGATGVAISFCDDNERKYVAGIQKLTRKVIPVLNPDTDIASIAELAAANATNSRHRKDAPRQEKQTEPPVAVAERRDRTEQETRNGRAGNRNGSPRNKRRNNGNRNSNRNRNQQATAKEDNRNGEESTGSDKSRKANTSRQENSTGNGQGRSRNSRRRKAKAKNKQNGNPNGKHEPRSDRKDEKKSERRSASQQADPATSAEKKSWFERWLKNW